MIYIQLDDILGFSANRGIEIDPDKVLELCESNPDLLITAIKIAKSHMRDRHLVDACCGGCGPLANVGTVTYDKYLELLSEIEQKERQDKADRQAKLKAMSARRAEFARARHDLVLKMLDSGVPYVCAHVECDAHENLTVDHIVPVVMGGTDELNNLQFMCRPHNSAKGARLKVVND